MIRDFFFFTIYPNYNLALTLSLIKTKTKHNCSKYTGTQQSGWLEDQKPFADQIGQFFFVYDQLPSFGWQFVGWSRTSIQWLLAIRYWRLFVTSAPLSWMQVHAEPLRMCTNVVYFRVMRRLYHRKWNWLCVNQQTMTTDKGSRWVMSYSNSALLNSFGTVNNWLATMRTMATKHLITSCLPFTDHTVEQLLIVDNHSFTVIPGSAIYIFADFDCKNSLRGTPLSKCTYTSPWFVETSLVVFLFGLYISVETVEVGTICWAADRQPLHLQSFIRSYKYFTIIPFFLASFGNQLYSLWQLLTDKIFQN